MNKTRNVEETDTSLCGGDVPDSTFSCNACEYGWESGSWTSGDTTTTSARGEL